MWRRKGEGGVWSGVVWCVGWGRGGEGRGGREEEKKGKDLSTDMFLVQTQTVEIGMARNI